MIPASPAVGASVGLSVRPAPRSDEFVGGDSFQDTLGRIGRPVASPPERERPPVKERTAEGAQDSPEPTETPGATPEAQQPPVKEIAGGVDAEARDARPQDAKGGKGNSSDAKPVEGKVLEGAEARGTPREGASPKLPTPVGSGGPPTGAPPTKHVDEPSTVPPSKSGGIGGIADDGEATGEQPTDDAPGKTDRVPGMQKPFRDRLGWTNREPVGSNVGLREQPPTPQAPVEGAAADGGAARSKEAPVATGESTPKPAQPAGVARPAGVAIAGEPTGVSADAGNAESHGFQSDDRGTSAQTRADATQSTRAPVAAAATPAEAAPVPAGDRGANPAAVVGADGLGTPRLGGAQKSIAPGAGTAGRGAQEGAPTAFEGAVTRGLSAVLRQSGGSVVIKLIPETLGPLKISMTLDKSSVSVTLDAATPAAHELLTKNLGSLRQSLEAQGLRVERMGVTLAQANHSTTAAEGATAPRGSEDPGAGDQDAAGGRSRGHSDQSSRDRRGGAHADPTPTFETFSDLIESSGAPMRFFATA